MTNSKLKKRKQERHQKEHKASVMANRQMSLLRKFDDPVLKTVCTNVENIDDGKEIGSKLCKFLFLTGRGVGIAAPQLGFTQKVIAMRSGEEFTSKVYFMMNPEVVEASEEKVTNEEGCLSYPGVYKNVERSKTVKVKYLDEEGTQVTKTFEKLGAIIVQHEIDHLSGRCLVGE